MPFKKGVDPNRNLKGRPKLGDTVAELARKVLAEKDKGVTREIRILNKFATLAEEGSAPHANFIFDRAYGKPQESMNLSGGVSLYEQGASEAARLADQAGRAELIREIRKLSGGKK
jgi:hypothetical protein